MKTSKNNLLWVPGRLVNPGVPGRVDGFFFLEFLVQLKPHRVASCGLCGQTAWVQVLALWLYNSGKVAQHLWPCFLIYKMCVYVCPVVSDSL